jgi:hypothetical protein
MFPGTDEGWLEFFNKLYLLATFVAVISGAIALIASNSMRTYGTRVGKSKDKLIADANERASQADKQAGEANRQAAIANKGAANANEAAGKANERAAQLEIRAKLAEGEVAKANAASKNAVAQVAAADARSVEAAAKAESFRLEIAKAQESAAKAEARAAEAKLELAKIKLPRTLSLEQQQRIATRLKPFAGQKFSFAGFGDSESVDLLRTFDAIMRASGWEREASQIGAIALSDVLPPPTVGIAYSSGIQAYAAPDNIAAHGALVAFADALTAEGLACTPHFTDQLKDKTPKLIAILIGRKP